MSDLDLTADICIVPCHQMAAAPAVPQAPDWITGTESTGAILTEKMDEKKRKLVSDSEKFSPRLFFVLLVFS